VGARAHQRARLHVAETHRDAQPLQLAELIGGVVARDREVSSGGPQVLAQREDVDPLGTQVLHRDQQLVPFFAQPADDARLGEEPGIELLGPAQQLERPGVAPPGPRQAVQPLDRLEVVVEDVRTRRDGDAQCRLAPLEVRNQHLDRGLGEPPPDLGNARREDFRPTVRQVIAVDASDHDVLQAHPGHRFGEPPGLSRIERTRGPVGDRAVGAVPRAHVAQDHERGRSVFPALTDVGTVRFLAHRVQLEVPHQVLQRQIVRSPGGLHPEPRWLAERRCGRSRRDAGGAGGGGRELNEGRGHQDSGR